MVDVVYLAQKRMPRAKKTTKDKSANLFFYAIRWECRYYIQYNAVLSRR